MQQELALRPFIPAKDFALSKKFYQALGFAITLEDPPIAIMKLGGHSFILQNFYVKELAENFMVQLLVRNLDTWWERITPNLTETFALHTVKAPAKQPWGLKVGFISDPSGILWHVAESPF